MDLPYVHEPHTEAVHLVRWMLEEGFLTPDELQETLGPEQVVRARNAVGDEI